MAERAEQIAANVAVERGASHFLRRNIRRALAEDGIASDIDVRVARLLGISIASGT
jgi:hypothetical protein